MRFSSEKLRGEGGDELVWLRYKWIELRALVHRGSFQVRGHSHPIEGTCTMKKGFILIQDCGIMKYTKTEMSPCIQCERATGILFAIVTQLGHKYIYCGREYC